MAFPPYLITIVSPVRDETADAIVSAAVANGFELSWRNVETGGAHVLRDRKLSDFVVGEKAADGVSTAAKTK
jgi:hypothetical protein